LGDLSDIMATFDTFSTFKPNSWIKSHDNRIKDCIACIHSNSDHQ
jgi:hypothetical protein